MIINELNVFKQGNDHLCLIPFIFPFFKVNVAVKKEEEWHWYYHRRFSKESSQQQEWMFSRTQVGCNLQEHFDGLLKALHFCQQQGLLDVQLENHMSVAVTALNSNSVQREACNILFQDVKMVIANLRNCEFFLVDKSCNLATLALADYVCNSYAVETWQGVSTAQELQTKTIHIWLSKY